MSSRGWMVCSLTSTCPTIWTTTKEAEYCSTRGCLRCSPTRSQKRNPHIFRLFFRDEWADTICNLARYACGSCARRRCFENVSLCIPNVFAFAENDFAPGLLRCFWATLQCTGSVAPETSFPPQPRRLNHVRMLRYKRSHERRMQQTALGVGLLATK